MMTSQYICVKVKYTGIIREWMKNVVAGFFFLYVFMFD